MDLTTVTGMPYIFPCILFLEFALAMYYFVSRPLLAYKFTNKNEPIHLTVLNIYGIGTVDALESIENNEEAKKESRDLACALKLYSKLIISCFYVCFASLLIGLVAG